MVNVSLSLPDHLKELIEAKVREGCCEDAGQYLCHLIFQDILPTIPENLEQQLWEGLESGKSIEIIDEWWEQERTHLLGKH